VTLWSRLAERAAAEGDITVGLIGAGYVARALLRQLADLDGFRPVLVANRSLDRAINCWRLPGRGLHDPVIVDDPDAAALAIMTGRPAVTSNPSVAIAADGIDVLVEATGAIDYGAAFVLEAIHAGRSVVSINAEVDAALGWLFHQEARRSGSVYTICDGDQPGVIMRVMDRVRWMGFEPLVAANCKRHLDVHQSPGDSAPFAARDGTSIEVTTSAGDGTKMNVECAVVANLTQMPPARRGMFGIQTDLDHACRDVLDSLPRTGVVDYTLGGDFGAGVFVIARAREPAAVARELRFFKMGDGPEYLLFSPYTLVHFDMPVSIAEVALDHAPLWAPSAPPVAEVVAIAKRPIQAGETFDGIGGETCYGQIEAVERATGLLPIALAQHARAVRPIAADEPILLDSVEVDDDAVIVRLKRQQDTMSTFAH
jgi:predicted homoserine dehydrogenase-like protein